MDTATLPGRIRFPLAGESYVDFVIRDEDRAAVLAQLADYGDLQLLVKDALQDLDSHEATA